MPRTKIIRVPSKGGPEMRTYWTEVRVPVLKKLKEGEIPPPPDNPPVDPATGKEIVDFQIPLPEPKSDKKK